MPTTEYFQMCNMNKTHTIKCQTRPSFRCVKTFIGPSTCAPKTPNRFEICKQVCLLCGASTLTCHHGQYIWSLAEMEHCSVQPTIQQLHCLSKQSVTATQHCFQQQSERQDATTLLWVSKWHQEGSV